MAIPIAIATADIHIRSSIPACRNDNFLEEQFGKLEFIINIANKYHVPIIVAGDLGHVAIWGDKLLSKVIPVLKKCDNEILVIPGQHDLPYHRISQWEESALSVLQSSNAIKVLLSGKPYTYIFKDIVKVSVNAFPYGVEITNPDKNTKADINIAVAHMMVIKNKPLWEGQQASKSKILLKKFPEYDFIITGDNHQTFTDTYQGQALINPGSMMRTTIDQINHKPAIFVLYDDLTFKKIYIPIDSNAFEDNYIDNILSTDEANKRLEAYIDKLNNNIELALSFEENMTKFLMDNAVEQEVKDIIWEHIE